MLQISKLHKSKHTVITSQSPSNSPRHYRPPNFPLHFSCFHSTVSAARPWPPAARTWPRTARPWPRAARPWPRAARPWPRAVRPWPRAARPWPPAARPWPPCCPRKSPAPTSPAWRWSQGGPPANSLGQFHDTSFNIYLHSFHSFHSFRAVLDNSRNQRYSLLCITPPAGRAARS